MLVDDSINTLEAFKIALEDEGHEVIPFHYLYGKKDIDKELLETYESMKPDLCILDGLEGKALRLAEGMKKKEHKRILIYSGNEEIVNEAKKYGIASYIKQEKRSWT